jgi:hypothetical protein
MRTAIEQMCESLLDEAVVMWERDGAVMTTSFAIGHARSVFAQPKNEVGLAISDYQRVELVAMLASTVGAVVVGRIDESYIAVVDAGAPPLAKGDLERMAETDPNINTAIVVQATDTASGEALVAVAVLTVDDNGLPQWDYSIYENADGQFIEDANDAIEISEEILIPTTDAQLREQLDELGWVIADSDDIGSEASK